MRTQKLLIVSAAMTAILSAASLSFADDTGSAGRTPTVTGSTPAPVGGTSTTGSAAMTPGSPSAAPTTSTATGTTTKAGVTTPPTTGVATTPSTPTSTTTTTAADTEGSMSPPTTSTSPPAGESITIYKKQRPNRPLLYTGGAILIGTYATTAAFHASNGPVGDKDLYIPVAGPWINLANRSCAGECPNETRDTILIAGSGVLQGVGAAMLLTSFFVPEKYAAARIQAGPIKMHVTPTAAAGAGGVGAIGTF